MKTKRRVPALLLSLLLVLSLVVGCGQNAAPAETTTAAQETTAAATTEEATSAQETTAEETEAESEAETEAAAQEIIEPDYSDEANWAYLELDKEGDADIFFICPSVYGGSDDACNMPLSDEDVKYSFSGAFALISFIGCELADFPHAVASRQYHACRDSCVVFYRKINLSAVFYQILHSLKHFRILRLHDEIFVQPGKIQIYKRLFILLLIRNYFQYNTSGIDLYFFMYQ